MNKFLIITLIVLSNVTLATENNILEYNNNISYKGVQGSLGYANFQE